MSVVLPYYHPPHTGRKKRAVALIGDTSKNGRRRGHYFGPIREFSAKFGKIIQRGTILSGYAGRETLAQEHYTASRKDQIDIW
jgi:hypothetical protein